MPTAGVPRPLAPISSCRQAAELPGKQQRAGGAAEGGQDPAPCQLQPQHRPVLRFQYGGRSAAAGGPLNDEWCDNLDELRCLFLRVTDATRTPAVLCRQTLFRAGRLVACSGQLRCEEPEETLCFDSLQAATSNDSI